MGPQAQHDLRVQGAGRPAQGETRRNQEVQGTVGQAQSPDLREHAERRPVETDRKTHHGGRDRVSCAAIALEPAHGAADQQVQEAQGEEKRQEEVVGSRTSIN